MVFACPGVIARWFPQKMTSALSPLTCAVTLNPRLVAGTAVHSRGAGFLWHVTGKVGLTASELCYRHERAMMKHAAADAGGDIFEKPEGLSNNEPGHWHRRVDHRTKSSTLTNRIIHKSHSAHR